MNRFFTLLLAASCLNTFGQVTYPYNPDGNADTLIGVTDLQDLLVVYGNAFTPADILVDGEGLSTVLTQLQSSIDSLSGLDHIEGATLVSWDFPFPDLGRPFVEIIGPSDDYVIPADTIALVFGTHAGNLNFVHSGISFNTGPSLTHKAFPVDESVVLNSLNENCYVHGVLVPKPQFMTIFSWDFDDGSWVVPQGMLFIPAGNIEDMQVNGSAGNIMANYNTLPLPSGTTLSAMNSGAKVTGYLVPHDYFTTANGTIDELGVIVDSLGLRLQELESLVSLINFGCTDPTACNYSAEVDIDDGSCEGLFGCTDPLSDNYSAAATCDDGTCLPYVGMVDYGGIVYSVDNGTARVLNIVEELSAGSETTSCYNAVGTLNSTTGSEGFSDWTLPSQNDWASICQEYNLVNLLNFINGGLSLDGVFIVNQQAYSSGNSYYFSCRTPGEGSCNTSPGTDYQVCPSATIRLVRSFSFED